MLSPSFITRGRMGTRKAALILMKNSHFDRTLQYIIRRRPSSVSCQAIYLICKSKKTRELEKDGYLPIEPLPSTVIVSDSCDTVLRVVESCPVPVQASVLLEEKVVSTLVNHIAVPAARLTIKIPVVLKQGKTLSMVPAYSSLTFLAYQLQSFYLQRCLTVFYI